MIGWLLVLSSRKHDWLYESVFSSLDANGSVIAGSPSRSFLGPTLDFRLGGHPLPLNFRRLTVWLRI